MPAPRRSRAKRSSDGPPERVPVTLEALGKVALAYLNRVGASRAAVERKLSSWVVSRGDPPDRDAARPLVAELLDRYQRSGILDDGRLAENAFESFRARGRSSNDIKRRLAARGVAPTAIAQASERERAQTVGAELAAAKKLVQKRRLGPFRPEADRAPNRRRDLGVLARAGFDFDTAIAALGTEQDDEF